MSKRRKINEKVLIPFTFGKEDVVAKITKIDNEYCSLCDDPNCKEWEELIDEDNEKIFHVSECEMFDYKK